MLKLQQLKFNMYNVKLSISLKTFIQCFENAEYIAIDIFDI